MNFVTGVVYIKNRVERCRTNVLNGIGLAGVTVRLNRGPLIGVWFASVFTKGVPEICQILGILVHRNNG